METTRIALIALLLGVSGAAACPERNRPPAAQPGTAHAEDEMYHTFRNHALQLKPGDLRLHADPGQILAVLMEMEAAEGVATLVAVADGTTSLYFSNGGAVIGTGERESVRAAAAQFRQAAWEYVAEMEPATAFPLPRPGFVRFYVVTERGVRTAEMPTREMQGLEHRLAPLFRKGNDLLTAVRMATGRQHGGP